MMKTARLSSRGQIVIPQAIRLAMQATSGAIIGFDSRGDKTVITVVRKKTAQPGDGYGLVKGGGRNVPRGKEGEAMRASMKKEARNASH